jgi:hypothetical protein
MSLGLAWEVPTTQPLYTPIEYCFETRGGSELALLPDHECSNKANKMICLRGWLRGFKEISYDWSGITLKKIGASTRLSGV